MAEEDKTPAIPFKIIKMESLEAAGGGIIFCDLVYDKRNRRYYSRPNPDGDFVITLDDLKPDNV